MDWGHLAQERDVATLVNTVMNTEVLKGGGFLTR